jgi:hypothetical protein
VSILPAPRAILGFCSRVVSLNVKNRAIAASPGSTRRQLSDRRCPGKVQVSAYRPIEEDELAYGKSGSHLARRPKDKRMLTGKLLKRQRVTIQHESLTRDFARCSLFVCHRVIGPLLGASLWCLCILIFPETSSPEYKSIRADGTTKRL